MQSLSGITVAYDRLLLATGSTPFIVPVPGHDLPGVIGFRDISDVDTMLQAARTHRHAVVIGGGLLGLEAANGLQRQGMDVTVVHMSGALMNQQLDAPASMLLKTALEARGLRFLMHAQTAEILGTDRVQGVRFADGTSIPADLVVMTAGVRPNIALARDSGLHCERAIVVDDCLQTTTRACTPWANACSTGAPRLASSRPLGAGARMGAHWPAQGTAATCSRPGAPN